MKNRASRIAIEIVREAIAKGFSVRSKLVGESMLPCLTEKREIVIGPVNPKEIKIGDIVVFERDEHLVAHRVIYKHKESKFSFITKGDSTFHIDPFVEEDDLVGKVIAVITCNGNVKVDRHTSRMVHCLTVICSTATYSMLHGASFLKKIFFGKKKNHLIYCSSRIFFEILSLLLTTITCLTCEGRQERKCKR